jgi:flagellar motor protein MotB
MKKRLNETKQFENSNVLIVIPTTFEEMALYGANTKWILSQATSKVKNYFEARGGYEGNLRIYINKKTNEKILEDIERGVFYNGFNNPLIFHGRTITELPEWTNVQIHGSDFDQTFGFFDQLDENKNMKKVVRLTESDVERLVKKIISEERKINKNELLNEGPKEWVLTAIMALAGLLGKTQAQNIEDKISKDDRIKKEIKSTLDDPDKLGAFTKDLSPEEIQRIQQNAEKNLEKLEKRGSKSTELKVKSVEQARNLIKSGWSPIYVSFDSDTTYLFNDTVVVENKTLDINLPSDDLFVTGGFQLSDIAKSQIESIIDSVNAIGGKVNLLQIESSTDTEPIKMGNQRLAELRAESVKNEFISNGVDSNIISTIAKPEQGPNIYSRSMSKGERTSARIQTAEFRYVKFKINITYADSLITPNLPKEKVVNTFQIRLVKSSVSSGGGRHKKPPIIRWRHRGSHKKKCFNVDACFKKFSQTAQF